MGRHEDNIIKNNKKKKIVILNAMPQVRMVGIKERRSAELKSSVYKASAFIVPFVMLSVLSPLATKS